MKQLQIRNAGRMGGTVTYVASEEIDGIKYNNRITKVNYNVIPDKIMSEVKKLRIHLLRVNEIWKEQADSFYNWQEGIFDQEACDKNKSAAKRLMETIERTNITQIDFSGESFVVGGTFKRFDGEISLKLSTELIKEDNDYHFFEEAISIIREIAPRAVDYANNSLSADKSQAAKRILLASVGKEQTEAAFGQMDDKTKDKLLQEYAESKGKVTIDLGELINPIETDGEAIMEEVAENNTVSGTGTSTEEVVIPAKEAAF